MQQDLFEASKAGDVEAIERIVSENPGSMREVDKDGITAMMFAMYCGQQRAAKKFVELGQVPDLYEACALGDMTRAGELLDSHPDMVNTHSPDGFTPLQLAAYFGHPELADDLLKRGADVHAVSQNPMKLTAIHAACSHGDPSVTKMLLDAGAEVNAQQEGGFTPLHSAAQNGNEDIIRILHRYGADAGIVSYDGKTPLELAIDNNHVGAVDLLRGRIEV